MNIDAVLTLFRYYAKFVPKEALEKIFVLTGSSGVPGYDETAAEMLNLPDDDVISDISSYIYSINEKFVSDKIRNNEKIILYVEYGAISYDPTRPKGTSQKLAVYVAFPLSMANNDNLKESLLMEKTLDILATILNKMETDQSDLDFCGNTKLIEFPAEIYPIESYAFYDHTGWMAMLDYETTNMI